MEHVFSRSEHERAPEIVVAAPASEVLLDPVQAAKTWPHESTMHPEFLEQIHERRVMSQSLHNVIAHLPLHTSIETAVENDIVSSEAVTAMYQDLTTLLGDGDSMRIALYMPFEFLPSRSWQPDDPELEIAAIDFRYMFLDAWYGLLSIHDARANFVDGDVLETELRTSDLDRVVKAAHLAPMMVQANILDAHTITEIMASTLDPVLFNSLCDALIILNDQELLGEKEAAFLQTTLDRNERTPLQPTVYKKEAGGHSAHKVIANLTARLAAWQNMLPVQDAQTTSNREKWLKEQALEAAVFALSEYAHDAILQDNTTATALREYMTTTTDPLAQHVLVEAVRRAIETTWMQGEQPTGLFNMYADQLKAYWQTGDATLQTRLSKLYRHCEKIGVVDEAFLRQRGLERNALQAPFSANLLQLQPEIDQLKDIAATIAEDSALKDLVYPVIAIGGSKLKGYGEPHSDLDVSVFIRPAANEDQRHEIHDRLATLFGNDHPIEFWLQEDDGQLKIKDFVDDATERARPDPLVADSYWTHILFGAAWVGSEAAIAELRQNVLANYFTSAQPLVNGRNPREFYIERLEQDVLQYRLMHKGFDRHYPRASKIETPNRHVIDGSSAFWDPMYRRIATSLFITNVFLPHID